MMEYEPKGTIDREGRKHHHPQKKGGGRIITPVVKTALDNCQNHHQGGISGMAFFPPETSQQSCSLLFTVGTSTDF